MSHLINLIKLLIFITSRLFLSFSHLYKYEINSHACMHTYILTSMHTCCIYTQSQSCMHEYFKSSQMVASLDVKQTFLINKSPHQNSEGLPCLVNEKTWFAIPSTDHLKDFALTPASLRQLL